MMVQRLKPEQIGPVLADLAKRGMLNYRLPEPVSGEAMAEFSERIAESPGGLCYGWFEPNLDARGVFVGIVSRDPFTGLMCGIEFVWWSDKPKAALELLSAFESDCRTVGCQRVLLGYYSRVEPARRRKLYGKLGYVDHSSAMVKVL